MGYNILMIYCTPNGYIRNNSSVLLSFGLLILVVLSAAVITVLGSAAQTPAAVWTKKISTQTEHTPHNNPLGAQIITAQTTAELEQLFANIDYHWPPSDLHEVPHVSLQQLPSDFPSIADATERKNLFLRVLLPIVLLENRRIHEQRKLLQLLFSQSLPSPLQAKGSPMGDWLITMKKELRIRGDLSNPEVQQRMLQRLDEIPPALALAQGAIESGWGTSRFALEGNSLFGQWTFQANSGLEPGKRDPEATHFVASFPNLQASVRAYMRNLNTGRAYREFRNSRATTRTQGKPLGALELAGHLHRYSQRGMDYVKELRVIIAGRSLVSLRNLPLAASPGQLASTMGPNSGQPSKPIQTPS